MTQQDLDDLRDALAGASPAPWLPYSQKEHPARVRAGQSYILLAPVDDNGGIDENGRNNQADRDVLLTAAMRNAVPRLLKEREMLLTALRPYVEIAFKSATMPPLRDRDFAGRAAIKYAEGSDE